MKICLNCGNEITNRNSKFCSQSCRTSYLREKSQRICVVCKKSFWVSPSSGKITCSAKCEKINRSQNGNKEKNMNSLRLAHEAASHSENSSSCETNSRAKSWVIESPEGNVYEINNLALWAENHKEILPSEPLRFCGGIRKIKYTLQGKVKRGVKSYMGWHLISYSESNHAREGFPDPKKRIPRHSIDDDERLERKRKRAREYYRKKKEGYYEGKENN